MCVKLVCVEVDVCEVEVCEVGVCEVEVSEKSENPTRGEVGKNRIFDTLCHSTY